MGDHPTDPDGAAPTAGAGTLSLRGRAPAPDRRPDTSTRQGRRRRRSAHGRRREDGVVLAIMAAGGVAGALLDRRVALGSRGRRPRARRRRCRHRRRRGERVSSMDLAGARCGRPGHGRRHVGGHGRGGRARPRPADRRTDPAAPGGRRRGRRPRVDGAAAHGQRRPARHERARVGCRGRTGARVRVPARVGAHVPADPLGARERVLAVVAVAGLAYGAALRSARPAAERGLAELDLGSPPPGPATTSQPPTTSRPRPTPSRPPMGISVVG